MEDVYRLVQQLQASVYAITTDVESAMHKGVLSQQRMRNIRRETLSAMKRVKMVRSATLTAFKVMKGIPVDED